MQQRWWGSVMKPIAALSIVRIMPKTTAPALMSTERSAALGAQAQLSFRHRDSQSYGGVVLGGSFAGLSTVLIIDSNTVQHGDQHDGQQGVQPSASGNHSVWSLLEQAILQHAVAAVSTCHPRPCSCARTAMAAPCRHRCGGDAFMHSCSCSCSCSC